MIWKVLSGSRDKIINTLLKNRGIKTKTAQKEFLDPPQPQFKINLSSAIARVRLSIKRGEKIVVYGDYDADGICATAILWEALKEAGAQVLPFIPAREKEGYGLSKEGIDSLDAKLIITVDNGIMAHEAVAYANSKKIDVIILDHHEKPKKLPKAYAIIHTPKLCAAGIAYFIAKALVSTPNSELRTTNSWLELAAIATVADLLPLVGVNRSIVKFGLESLNATKRIGLKALFEVAGIQKVGTYEVGYMIGPRLNASGRIESALTALRLLCTHNAEKAKELAQLLNNTNRERQEMTLEMSEHAKENYELRIKNYAEKIIIVDDEKYHQGIIGLIAGKLVEKYYLPSIVIAKGEGVSKASARSIAGFNIIEAIRSCESLLINAGGHPMAAGFSLKTEMISDFKHQIYQIASAQISEEMLEKTLRVDCELDLSKIDYSLFTALCSLAPYGMGNPEPVFASTGKIQNIRSVGAEGKHLKLTVGHPGGSEATDRVSYDAIFFSGGHWLPKLKVGQQIKLAYSLDLNIFNGKSSLQLKVKDIVI